MARPAAPGHAVHLSPGSKEVACRPPAVVFLDDDRGLPCGTVDGRGCDLEHDGGTGGEGDPQRASGVRDRHVRAELEKGPKTLSARTSTGGSCPSARGVGGPRGWELQGGADGADDELAVGYGGRSAPPGSAVRGAQRRGGPAAKRRPTVPRADHPAEQPFAARTPEQTLAGATRSCTSVGEETGSGVALRNAGGVPLPHSSTSTPGKATWPCREQPVRPALLHRPRDRRRTGGNKITRPDGIRAPGSRHPRRALGPRGTSAGGLIHD